MASGFGPTPQRRPGPAGAAVQEAFMRTRFVISAGLVVGALGVLLLGAPEARAQVSGRIYLTKEQVPETAKGAALRKLLRKRLTVLQKSVTGDGWSAYGFARLKLRPAAKMMALTHNDGKIQIVVRKKIKRRWVRQKVGEIDYSKRDRIVRFELSLSDGHQIPARKRTELQLVVQNKRKRDIVLARTYFSIR